MITIDQLLESVDLDFEPRWVTKDSDGTIICWAGEPQQSTATQAWIQINPYCCGKNIARCLKLAEFENKPWTECIYEVPRKTTVKIEKLEKITTINHSTEAAFCMSAHYWLNEIIKKQGEIVDAVNELKGAKNE